MRAAIVVVGTSLGGFHAMQTLLQGLPASFPLPVVVAQHRHKDSDCVMIDLLQQHSTLPVVEAEDKLAIMGGQIYIAPPDYHLLVEQGSLALSTEAPVMYARPSIDVLFESAADSYGAGVVGVVLTGASADGSRGLRRIKAQGGLAVVQDPATAESPVMPEAAIAAVVVDRILPLGEIAPYLISLTLATSR